MNPNVVIQLILDTRKLLDTLAPQIGHVNTIPRITLEFWPESKVEAYLSSKGVPPLQTLPGKGVPVVVPTQTPTSSVSKPWTPGPKYIRLLREEEERFARIEVERAEKARHKHKQEETEEARRKRKQTDEQKKEQDDIQKSRNKTNETEGGVRKGGTPLPGHEYILDHFEKAPDLGPDDTLASCPFGDACTNPVHAAKIAKKRAAAEKSAKFLADRAAKRKERDEARKSGSSKEKEKDKDKKKKQSTKDKEKSKKKSTKDKEKSTQKAKDQNKAKRKRTFSKSETSVSGEKKRKQQEADVAKVQERVKKELEEQEKLENIANIEILDKARREKEAHEAREQRERLLKEQEEKDRQTRESLETKGRTHTGGSGVVRPHDDSDDVDVEGEEEQEEESEDEDEDGADAETDEERAKRDAEFAKQGIKIIQWTNKRGKVHETFDMSEMKVDPNWDGQERKRMGEELMAKHGLIRDGWTFVYSKKATKRGGLCSFKKKQLIITWEYAKRIAEKDFINTMLHEIAHKLYFDQLKFHPEWRKYDRSGKELHQVHGEQWKRIAINIGCNGARCHHYKFSKTKPKPWLQYCPNGHFSIETIKRLTPGRHKYCNICKATTLEKPNPEYLALNPNTLVFNTPAKATRYLRTCPCGQYKKYTNTKMKPTQKKFMCKKCKGTIFEKPNPDR